MSQSTAQSFKIVQCMATQFKFVYRFSQQQQQQQQQNYFN